MLVADLILNLDYEELDRRFLTPYRKGEPLLNKGKTVASDDIGHLRIYRSSKYLGASQYRPHHMHRIANEITDELITGPPGWDPAASAMRSGNQSPASDSRDVFVVHGRHLAARDALFEFLRAIGLHPMEWAEAVQLTNKPTPYISEILDAAFAQAHAIVVLFTPDDEARLRRDLVVPNDPAYETSLAGQARPNVLFEAGIAMGRDENRTILVELGTLRPFSDIAGRHVLRLDGSSMRRQELAQRLKAAGCPVRLDGTDWHTAGDFDSANSIDAAQLSDTPDTGNEGQQLPQISMEARELLVAASQDSHGLIFMARTVGGLIVQSNGKSFNQGNDARTEAKWEQALNDLLELDCIRLASSRGESFRMTQRGYEIADSLGNSINTP